MTFASTFIYKMDKRYQIFKKECCDAEERDGVSSRTLEFDRLIEDVKMGDFVPHLPPVFTVTGDNKRKADGDTNADICRKNSKQGGGKGNEDSKRVVNKEFDKELKLSDEEWKKISGNKELLKLWPKLTDKCSMCHRWNSKSYCFRNCANIEAHCPPLHEKHTKYKGWLVKAKKTAIRATDGAGWDLAVASLNQSRPTPARMRRESDFC
jgi:hypothetical protein